MFESFSPKQDSYQEPSGEKFKKHFSEGKAADEQAILQHIEERHERYPQQLSFLSLERTLDLALSDNALEAYKKAGYVLRKDSELPFFRLTDLDAALSLLERFKDRLPNLYQANIKKVLDHADSIKQIFLDYRRLREKGEGRDAADASALISALDTLHKIDPNLFPADLVDITDEERKQAMWKPTTRGSE
jgi:hypothetical protein